MSSFEISLLLLLALNALALLWIAVTVSIWAAGPVILAAARGPQAVAESARETP